MYSVIKGEHRITSLPKMKNMVVYLLVEKHLEGFDVCTRKVTHGIASLSYYFNAVTLLIKMTYQFFKITLLRNFPSTNL